MANRSRRISLLLGLLLLTGCGPSYHAVSGVITLDGKTMEGVSVSFIPDGPGQPAVGTTDGSGRYTLETNNAQGVLPGTYKVCITKIAFTPYDERAGTGGEPIPSPIPKKYAKPETSGLSVTVPGGEGAYDLKLVTK